MANSVGAWGVGKSDRDVLAGGAEGPQALVRASPS